MDKVEINKTIKLSEHMTLGELTVTSVKTADKNIPSHVAIENLKRVCKWLEGWGSDLESFDGVRGRYPRRGQRTAHPLCLHSDRHRRRH